MNEKKPLLRLDELADHVNELIRLGKGDLGRLAHIKDTLQQNKTLYESDKEYLEKLSRQYLNDKPDVDDTHYDQPNSNLFCFKCGQNLKLGTSFCPKCGIPQENQKSESSCGKCGNKIHGNNPCMNCNQSTNNPTKHQKKGRSKKKKIGIAFGIVILLFFGLVILSSNNNEYVEKELNETYNKTVNWQDTTVEIQQKILDKTEYNWEELSYDELMRHNEKYVGKTVNLRGQVLQVQNVHGDEYIALVNSKCETIMSFFLCARDPIWINYSSVRILDEDIISFWGNVKGLKSYESIMGAPMTVPEIDVIAINIDAKKGEKQF